jgi:hypothetical protein
VTKSEDYGWALLKPDVFAAIMDFYSSGEPLFYDAQAGVESTGLARRWAGLLIALGAGLSHYQVLVTPARHEFVAGHGLPYRVGNPTCVGQTRNLQDTGAAEHMIHEDDDEVSRRCA